MYIGKLKAIAEDLRKQCNNGVPAKFVLRSIRDLQTATNAFRDNELDVFNRAWNNFGKAHMMCVRIKAANGQFYTKFAPLPLETEIWDWSDIQEGDWRHT
jgi:hypothetical protein